MKENKKAVSPVISAVLALMIVTSTMTAVFVWGVPYIDQLNTVTSTENSLSQFSSVIDSIDELTNSNVNDSRISMLSVNKGGVSAGSDEVGKDRIVAMYSYDDGYDFTVSGLDTCFLAGTKVLMADRSYKNIEEINIGDMVLSYDEHSGRVVSCRVAKVFVHSANEMADYYLLINNGLRVTPNHRFYSSGSWVFAGDLKVGDSLFSSNMVLNYNRVLNYRVYSIEKIYERERSFDLEVEGCHTYFVSVGIGGVDVLAHNGPDPGGGVGGGSQPLWSVDAGGPYFGYVGKPVTFYGYVSGMPCSCDDQPSCLLISWDFGDGTEPQEQIIPKANNPPRTYTGTHIYASKGTYTFTFAAVFYCDPEDQKEDTATVYIYEPFVLNNSKDTSIREYEGTPPWNYKFKNYGKSPKLSVDSLNSIMYAGREHTLIKFDLSPFPVLIGSTIIDARLGLYYYEWKNNNPKNKYLDCHRLIYDWDEGGKYNDYGDANWINRSYNEDENRHIEWIKPGGDYSSSLTNTSKIPDIGDGPSYNPTWMNWTVTEDVKKFLGGVSNYGWLIKFRETSSSHSYLMNFSSNETNLGNQYKPKLEIKYLKTNTLLLNDGDVQKNSATLRGEVISDADNSCKYGFYYKKSNGDYWIFTGWSQDLKGKNDEFSWRIMGLTAGTLYMYRASIKCQYQSNDFVNNATIMYFLTPPGDITNFNAEAVTPGEIKLSWTNGEGGDGAYIEWFDTTPPSQWNPEPYNQSRNKLGMNGGYCEDTNFQHTGLTPGTTYYYKAWAYADDYDRKSNGSSNFPFGNNYSKNAETFNAPIIYTYEPKVIHSRDVTLSGKLTHTGMGEKCKVWFEYGLTEECYTRSKNFNWTNGTGSCFFNITVDGLKPGTKYYYRAVYEAIYGGGYTYRYRDPNVRLFTTLINDLEIISPQYGDGWIKGKTYKIEWYYGPKLKDTNVTIELYAGKTRCRGAIDGYDYVELPINYSGTDKNGSFNWLIPKSLTNGKFIYRIKITSVFDPNIYDYSDYFSIKDIHEGIVWNRTIEPEYDGGNNKYLIDCESDCDGDEFYITMIKGSLNRAEIYGLYYGGELCDCSFSGAVQIDLYNDSYCFGSIILLDSDSLTYESQSSGGTYISTIENGGLLYSDPSINKYLKKTPPIYAGGSVFSMHAVQLVASPFSAGGSGGFRVRIKTIVNLNSIREKEYVYNLRLQFYGDNAELWLKYFEINYPGFERQGDTLFYKPSTSSVWFVFSHTSIQVSFM